MGRNYKSRWGCICYIRYFSNYNSRVPEELPKCNTVPVVREGLDIAENTEAEDLHEIVKWDGNSSVKFQGDKAEFIEEIAAEKELKPVKVYLRTNQEKIFIIWDDCYPHRKR